MLYLPIFEFELYVCWSLDRYFFSFPPTMKLFCIKHEIVFLVFTQKIFSPTDLLPTFILPQKQSSWAQQL